MLTENSDRLRIRLSSTGGDGKPGRSSSLKGSSFWWKSDIGVLTGEVDALRGVGGVISTRTGPVGDTACI